MSPEAHSPENVGAPTIAIAHSSLTRYNDESAYKSKCPACKEGVLLVMRDQKTLELRKDDRCILCAQHVIYSDIDELRRKDGPWPKSHF